MIFDIKPGSANPRNSEGDTILLADGSLLVAWTHFQGREDHARADVSGVVTTDWGETWSTPRLLVSPDEAKLNVMSVSLLREARTGDILMFYLRKNGFDDCRVFLRRSQDEAKNWSAPQLVCTKEGYHVMNNARVVQLESGRLLAPVALTHDYAASHHQLAFCYLSDDGGASWRAGRGSVGLPQSAVGCQEPGLVELDRGLLMYIRTDQDYVYGALSSDGGETWGDPWAFHDLPAPAAPTTLARWPSGRLFAIYNHRTDGARAGWEGRTPLAVARSDDQGRTWHRLDDIESDPNHCYGYTSLRIYDRRVVLTYYVWPKSSSASFDRTTLRCRILPLVWFERR